MTCANVDAERCYVDLPTGIRMAYLEVGPKNGPTVLLVHGLADSALSWVPTIAALHAAAPSLHIIAPDVRGHGMTSMPSGPHCVATPESCFQLSMMADDIAALLDVKGITKVSFVGHSMGSVIGQELALDHPERVQRLVLIATSNRVKDNASLRDYLLEKDVLGTWVKTLKQRGMTPERIYSARIKDALPSAAAWLKANWLIDPVADPRLLSRVSFATAENRIGTLIGATRALLASDNTERLKGLNLPVLILWGSRDDLFQRTPDQDGIIAALRATPALVSSPMTWKAYGRNHLPIDTSSPDIAHGVIWDAPQDVAHDILRFLETGRPVDNWVYAVRRAGHVVLKREVGGANIVRIH
ncbi:MAG: hypothetical protein JWR80_6631 [Bradyrhizobium sp.]|nr:hypothetical protein [Bradyrhizobium sp.]